MSINTNGALGLAEFATSEFAPIEVTTGEVCPQGGIWHPKDCQQHTRSIGIYDRMPPSPTGCSQLWVLKTSTGDNQG